MPQKSKPIAIRGALVITRDLAFAAGQDAANRAMAKRVGQNPRAQKRWTAEEADIAAETTNQLLLYVPVERGGLEGLNLSPRMRADLGRPRRPRHHRRPRRILGARRQAGSRPHLRGALMPAAQPAAPAITPAEHSTSTCDDCGGEGGYEVAVATRAPPWGDGADGGYWVDCPTCGGSGWVDGTPPDLGMDELTERCGEWP